MRYKKPIEYAVNHVAKCIVETRNFLSSLDPNEGFSDEPISPSQRKRYTPKISKAPVNARDITSVLD